MRNTGAAGRRSPGREIPHAQKAPAAVPDEQHGESGGSFLCACDAGGGWALPHDGSMTDPTAAAEGESIFPRSGCGRAAVRRPPLPRTGDSPCAQNALAAPAEAWEAERAMGGRRGPAGRMEGKGGVCGRPRRPDAHAHAGHASRTLFANAAADILCCSLSNAAILRGYSPYGYSPYRYSPYGYSPYGYSLRKYIAYTHIAHPFLCLPPSSHHILNPDPIFPPSHKENI